MKGQNATNTPVHQVKKNTHRTPKPSESNRNNKRENYSKHPTGFTVTQSTVVLLVIVKKKKESANVRNSKKTKKER